MYYNVGNVEFCSCQKVQLTSVLILPYFRNVESFTSSHYMLCCL
jgi:hypothetical protein